MVLDIEKTENLKPNLPRSSHPELPCKKGVHNSFANFIQKHLRWSLFVNKVAGWKFATLLKKILW